MDLAASRKSADHWGVSSVGSVSVTLAADANRLEAQATCAGEVQIAAGESICGAMLTMRADSPLCQCPCVVHVVIAMSPDSMSTLRGASFYAEFVRDGGSDQRSDALAGWTEDDEALRLVFREELRNPASPSGSELTGRRAVRIMVRNDDPSTALTIAEGTVLFSILEVCPPCMAVVPHNCATAESEREGDPTRVPLLGATSSVAFSEGDAVAVTVVALAAFSDATSESPIGMTLGTTYTIRVLSDVVLESQGAFFSQKAVVSDVSEGERSFSLSRVTKSLVSPSNIVLRLTPEGLALAMLTCVQDGVSGLVQSQGTVRAVSALPSFDAAPPISSMFVVDAAHDGMEQSEIGGDGTADATVAAICLSAQDNAEGESSITLLSGTYVSGFVAGDEGEGLAPPAELVYELLVFAKRDHPVSSPSNEFTVRFEDDFAAGEMTGQFSTFNPMTLARTFQSYTDIQSDRDDGSPYSGTKIVVRARHGVAWRVVLPVGQSMSVGDSVNVRFRTIARTGMEFPRSWPASMHWRIASVCEQMNEVRFNPDSTYRRGGFGYHRSLSLMTYGGSGESQRVPLPLSAAMVLESKSALSGQVSLCLRVRADNARDVVVYIEKQSSWESHTVAAGAGAVVVSESSSDVLTARAKRIAFVVPALAEGEADFSEPYHELFELIWIWPGDACVFDALGAPLRCAAEVDDETGGALAVDSAAGQTFRCHVRKWDEDQEVRIHLLVMCDPSALTVTMNGNALGASVSSESAYALRGENYAVESWRSAFAPNLTIVVPAEAESVGDSLLISVSDLPPACGLVACSVDPRWALFRDAWNVVECTGRARAYTVETETERGVWSTAVAVRSHSDDGFSFNFEGTSRLARLEMRNDKAFACTPYFASAAIQAANLTFNGLFHYVGATMERPDILAAYVGPLDITSVYTQYEDSYSQLNFTCEDGTAVARDLLPNSGADIYRDIAYHATGPTPIEGDEPARLRGFRRGVNLYFVGNAVLNRYFGDGVELLRVVGAAPADIAVLRHSGSTAASEFDVGPLLAPSTYPLVVSFGAADGATGTFAAGVFDARGESSSLEGKGFTLRRLFNAAASGSFANQEIGSAEIEARFDSYGRIAADVLAGAGDIAAATVLLMPTGSPGGGGPMMAMPPTLGSRVVAVSASTASTYTVETLGEGGGGGDPHVAPADGGPSFELDAATRAVRFIDTDRALPSGARILVNAAADFLSEREVDAIVAASGLRRTDAMRMTFWSAYYVALLDRAGATVSALLVDAKTLSPIFANGNVHGHADGRPASPLIATNGISLSPVRRAVEMPDPARGASATCAAAEGAISREVIVCADNHSEMISVQLFFDDRSHVRSAIRLRIGNHRALHERGATGCFFSRRWSRPIASVVSHDPMRGDAPEDLSLAKRRREV